MKLAIATGTRADWGLLQPLAAELRNRGADIAVIAAHQHLMPQMGDTLREIIDDGFSPAALVPAEGSAPQIMAMAARGAADALAEIRPDAIIILGDRCEMLGFASAALLSGVPIVHIAGGTVSEGAFDDSVRNAITKMATLHLPETDLCACRIMQMGEDPQHVIAVGAAGVQNSLSIPRLSLLELADSLAWPPLADSAKEILYPCSSEQDLADSAKEILYPCSSEQDLAGSAKKILDPGSSERTLAGSAKGFPKGFLVVTLHAATLESASPLEIQRNLLDALRALPESIRFLITYPNCDVDPAPLIASLHDFEAEDPQRVKVIPSLGRVRYLSAVAESLGVVGNSSSGLVEVPSLGVPTLDIGRRQHGRECGPSVLHCAADRDSISAGLQKILSPEFQALASKKINPYHRPDTIGRMADTILSFPFSPFPPKPFFHIHKDENFKAGIAQT